MPDAGALLHYEFLRPEPDGSGSGIESLDDKRIRNMHETYRVRRVVWWLGAMVLAVGPVQADWAQWRGPEGSGVSPESNWAVGKLVPEPSVLWRTNVGRGYASVSVAGGRLYTMGNEGDRDVVRCLAVSTGKEIWRHTYTCRGGSYPGPRATPVKDGNLLFSVSRAGDVYALDITTGHPVWHRNVAEELGARDPRWGHAASALVVGDIVLLNACTSGVALQKSTGKTIWASDPGICNYATPVLARLDGDAYAVVMGKDMVYGVDVGTGRRLWSFPWEESKYDVNAADPVISGTHVFVSSGYGKGCAVRRVERGATHLVWSNQRMRNHFSSCVLIDGYLYGIDGNAGRGDLVCLSFASGDEAWRENLGFGSLMAAAGKLLVLNERGRLHVVEAVPEGYREAARCETGLSPRCWTAPVLCEGLIYCRNQKGDLVCLDVRP